MRRAAAVGVVALVLTGTAASTSAQETLSVKPSAPGLGGPVTTKTSFVKGQKYAVVVSGTVNYTAQAENSPPVNQRRDAFYCFAGCGSGVQWSQGLGVQYHGSFQPTHAYDSTKNNAAPKYNSSHVYRFVYDEAQGPLRFEATPYDAGGKYVRDIDKYSGGFTVAIFGDAAELPPWVRYTFTAGLRALPDRVPRDMVRAIVTVVAAAVSEDKARVGRRERLTVKSGRVIVSIDNTVKPDTRQSFRVTGARYGVTSTGTEIVWLDLARISSNDPDCPKPARADLVMQKHADDDRRDGVSFSVVGCVHSYKWTRAKLRSKEIMKLFFRTAD